MSSHIQRVRILYKSILKLHRGLPIEIKELGDQYVRDEFKRHKTINNEDQIKAFMWEWTDYAINLANQLSVQNIQAEKKIGKNLEEDTILNKFSDEQIVQLNELYLASKGKESETVEDKK